LRPVIIIIGVVLLFLGIALFVGGTFTALGSTTIISTFSSPQTGEYVSTELVVNSTSTVVVSSPTSEGGLIPAQDLALVNSSSSLSSYAISPRSTAGGAAAYTNLVGDYYYVVFSSTQPSSRIVISSGHLSRTIGAGLLVLGGIVLFLAGIIVAIIGVVLKKRPPATPPPPPVYPGTQR
jgi:hypothetical protein